MDMNVRLDSETGHLCGVRNYERTEGRMDRPRVRCSHFGAQGWKVSIEVNPKRIKAFFKDLIVAYAA